MSLNELTRNAFQSGLSAAKWLSLCKLFISRELSHPSRQEIECELSNSVLVLFKSYPGDHELKSYAIHAIQDGTLSLATFVSTSLAAAKSKEMHNAATLEVLCRISLDCHMASGMLPIGSLVPFAESPAVILNTVHDALTLLRKALELPSSSHIRQHVTAASSLLLLLLTTVTDFSQIPNDQARAYCQEAEDVLLHSSRLDDQLRQMLQSSAYSLSFLVGDDTKLPRDAQMHTLQFALRKGDIVSSNSDKDVITCGLLLHSLVLHRADNFGSGDGDRAVAMLVALFRWASWTPTTFYTQLLQSAVICISQEASSKDRLKMALLWRAFIVGRLPHLLLRFEQAIDLEGISEADWRPAIKQALNLILQRTDLLEKCDILCQQGENDHPGASLPQRTFVSEILHALSLIGLVDQAFVTALPQSEFHSKLQTEAQDHGLELESYLETKLGVDIGMDDVALFMGKLWRDPCCHSTFAELVRKRFVSAAASSDLEPLGHLCKILYTHEHGLEILALQVKLTDLVACALAIIEDYDCESVGDPQTAVTHIGDVVFFLQITLGRYHLGKCKFHLGERKLSTDLLDSAGVIYRIEDLKGEDLAAFNTWLKALFDSQSEGIEDSVLRSIRPRNHLKIAATVLSHAIQSFAERKIDKSVFGNGIQYFLGPLLIWTVGGVLRALLIEMRRKSYFSPIYIEVVQSFLNPNSCPQPILRLLANMILNTLPQTKPPSALSAAQNAYSFDPTSIRKIATAALGLPWEGSPLVPHLSLFGGLIRFPYLLTESRSTSPLKDTDSVPVSIVPSNPVLQAIRDALASARTGKAPYLDVDRCLQWTNPTNFLFSLWGELSVASAMGGLEAPRRIATYVLTTPRTPRSPPLLPIFLHLVLPTLISTTDHLVPPEQTMSVELLVSVVSSALTAALYVEWALLSVCKEQRLVLGQPALAMARRLGGELRRKSKSPTSSVLVQRFAASSAFIANFPTFMAEF